MNINIKVEANCFLEACCYIEDGRNEISEKLKTTFSEEEWAFVNMLREDEEFFPLCEFYVHSEEKSPEGIIGFMSALSPADFYYFFKNEDIPKAEIERLDSLFLENLQKLAIKVLGKTYEFLGADFMEKEYENKVKEITTKLQGMAPLEVAQDFMGKRYARVSEYERYTFVPLKYHKHGSRRYFNEKELLLILPMEEVVKPLSLEEMGLVLKVIGDSTRLEILQLLKGKAMYGKEIAETLNMRAPTITHHIEQLNSIKLLHMEKIGQIKYYSLNRRRFKELIKELNMFTN